VFFGKPLYSDKASLHPGILMGTGEFNTGRGGRGGGTLPWTCIPSRGGVERRKYSWSLYATENRISSSLINYSASI